MAHPKRRQSNTRTAKRRTHDKAVAPTLAICPNCGAWHVFHTVWKQPLNKQERKTHPFKMRFF